MEIKAAVLREAKGRFQLENLQLSAPHADELLVRIVGTGVCHTDLICRDQVYPVPLPVVLGHEGAGVVEAVGQAITGFQPGDHVVLSFRSCGKCLNCLAGLPSRCLAIFSCNFSCAREDGSSALCSGSGPVHGHFFGQSSFASYAIAHHSNAIKVSKEVPLEYLGPLGCGIQTGAGAVINALAPKAGSSMAIFGAGSVGLAAVMASSIVGCTKIIAIDPNAQRRDLAQQLGATHVINPAEADPVEMVHEMTAAGAEYSLECTGLPAVFRQAVDALSVTGICGLIGAAPMGTEVTLDMNSIMFGRTVKGVIEGDSVPQIFIPRLVELFRQGRFPIDKLVRFYALDEIEQAVADSQQGRVVKAVLRP